MNDKRERKLGIAQNLQTGVRSGSQAGPRAQFEEFTASQLYCPKCKVAQPVRERLLLYLPSGDLKDLICARCRTSVGKKTG